MKNKKLSIQKARTKLNLIFPNEKIIGTHIGKEFYDFYTENNLEGKIHFYRVYKENGKISKQY